jgi:hypothetical protein
MWARRRAVLIIMVIILAGQLFGFIKITGKLLIPDAIGGEKSYKCVLTITRAKIRIECDKEIFQPFNEFDAPRQSRLNIKASDLETIEIDENDKKIYLRVKKAFVIRYRNILNIESGYVRFSFETGHVFTEFWVIIFSYENPFDIGYLDKKVLKSINDRAYPVFTKYCSYH